MAAFDDLIPGGKQAATGGLFDDLIPTKPKSRNIAAVANDTVIEAANALAGGVKSAADFVRPGNALSSFIDENIIKPGEASQSDVVKGEKARYASEMEAADGIGSEIGATLGYVGRNPLIAAAQAAGSFALPGAAVKGGGMLASLGGAGAKGLATGGLAGGAVAGAALSGGDAAGTAYELVKRAGGSEDEAVQAARKASVLPAAIGAAGGVIGAERLLAGAGGFKGGMLGRALKTAGVEGAQEAVEEGVTQYEGQRAAVPFDPNIDPMKGVAGAATMGGVLGAATGGGVSLLSGEAGKKLAADPVAGVPTLAIGNTPDPYISFPDGTVGKRADVDRYVNNLPEDQRVAARAKLLGLKPQKADPVSSILVSEDVDSAINSAQRAVGYYVPRIPIGDVSDLVPDETINADVAFMKFRSPQQIAEDGMPRIPTGEAVEIERRAMDRGIPAGDATEMIPAGEATEVPDIPVGELSYIEPEAGMAPRSPRSDAVDIDPAAPNAVAGYIKRMAGINTPAARAFVQDYRAGRINDADVLSLILPRQSTEPTADQRIAAAAAQAPKREVLSTDILTADGMPYGSKTAANVRAVKEGLTPASVIEIPGAGWVVRPKKASNVTQPDVPANARVADRPADGGGDQPGGSGGTVGRVADDGRTRPVDAGLPETAAGGNADQAAGSGGGNAGAALTPGAAITLDGQSYTVKDAKPSALILTRTKEDGGTESRVIRAGTEPWNRITQGGGDATQVAQPAGAAISTDALKQTAGPTNTASWVIREKSTGKVVMETFDRKKVDALNTDRYEAVPIQQYLGSLSQKTDANPTTSTTQSQAPAPASATEATGRVPAAGSAGVETDGLTGKKIDNEWTAFAPESGTKSIPRADMPQIRAEHRGAMVNFLAARGITHEVDEDVPAASLKPTQAEFSPEKVKKAGEFTGGDRSILVSADGHVLDGHHQWMAKHQAGETVKVIRLNAPIDKLLAEVKEFPSASVSEGATNATAPVEAASTGGAAAPDAVAPVSQPKPPKVYKTKEGAKIASKLSGNTKRVKKIAGGFILRDATDKEVAAAHAASKRQKARGATGGGPGLLAQIARRGGLDRQSAARDAGVNKDDFSRASGVFGMPIFRANGGKSAEHMREVLIEDKYLPEGATLRDLEDAIGEALNGRAVLPMDHDYDADLEARQAELEAGFYAEDDPLADLTYDDLQDIGYVGASAEAQQASEDLIAAAEALGIDVDTIRENADSETRGQTDDQYQAAVQRLTREAIASAGRNAQGTDATGPGKSNRDSGQGAGDQGQEQGREGLTLEAQSPADLKAKAEREESATKAEAAKKAADQARLRKEAEARDLKARADATVDDFQLGQDADQQMSGMDDMFAEPTKVDTSAERVQKAVESEQVAPAETEDEEAPQLSEAQARKQFEWRDLGQKDGVKTHMLFWYEKPEDKGTGSSMGRVQVTRYEGSSGWQIDSEGEKYPSLADAKKAAIEVGMRMNREQGWIKTEPATQAAAILDAAAEPPKGAERLSVIKDVKAGAITPEEVSAAYPAAQEAAPAAAEATTGTESLNKRHSTPKKQALTPGGSLKADATNSKADSSVWYYQGDMGALRFTASVTMDGKPDPGADRAKAMLAQIASAQDAGWKRANYRAGSLGTVWVFERGGDFLTRAGMENAAAGVLARPVLSEDKAGFLSMATQQFELARAFDDWLNTLPADQQENRGVVVRKMGETPVGEWARIEDDNGGVALRYYDKSGLQFRVGFSARNWGEMRAYVRELAARFDQSRDASEYEIGRLISDAGRDANAAGPGTQAPDGWVFSAGLTFIGSVDAEVARLNSLADGREYKTFRNGIIQRPAAEATAPVSKKPDPAKPASKTPTVDAHQELFKAVRAGTATPDEFKAMYARVRDGKEAITAELNTSTKDELLKGINVQLRPGTTKGELVEAIYKGLLTRFALGKEYGPNSYVMSRDGLANHEKKRAEALTALVEGQTAESLAEYAAEAKAEFDAALTARTARLESIKDPKTLDDFRAFNTYHLREGKTGREVRFMLTPEQRALMDELHATMTRGSRKASTDADRNRISTAGQSTTGEIIATKHTRDGHDLWVVKLSDRVSKEDYGTLLAGAKRLGGNYSSYRGGGAIPGFQFSTPDAAQAFLKLAGGDKTDAQAVAAERRDAFADDRSQSATERLNEMADRLEERADDSLGRDRKTNTSRRAGQAASAEAAASADKAMARTMRNLATAIGQGAAKFLDRVRQKVQVEMLQNMLRTAQYDELRTKFPAYIDQERNKGTAPTFETADFAEFPTFTAYRSDLASLARQLLEVDGTKLIGQRLMKVADDVSAAYLEFAKANFSKVATFSSKTGGVAAFGTSAAAEAAIARSGYKGKAIAYQVKRGEHTVIMSPSEAIARGIWKGDGDKRITLDPDLGAEMVEKIGRAARRGSKVSVPWQLESAYDRRKALARMGIETPAEMRAALREFVSLREQAAAPDKVKQLERAMIGRRNDGMDFFPTPEATADEMVAAADIQPGMRVLEPSAGWGHIAERIRAAGFEPDVGEMSSDRRELLEAKGFNVVGRDFTEMSPPARNAGPSVPRADLVAAQNAARGEALTQIVDALQFFDRGDIDGAADMVERAQRVTEDRAFLDASKGLGDRLRLSMAGYDRILMNPPFSDGRDIQHVRHAFDLLKPGGRVVAIMGESAFTNQNKRATEFREWLESVGGTEEKLPDGTFLDSDLPVNTGANARMVVIDKPGAEPTTQFSRAPDARLELEAADAVGREFWRKIDNGESFTEQEVLDALSINRRGSRRNARGMRSVADQAGTGTATVGWQGDLASFGPYTSRASWDGDNFNVFFVPDSLAAGADLNDDAQARDKALVHASFKSAPGGGYELSLNDPQPGSTAQAAAEAAGISAQAGVESKRYTQIALRAGDVTGRMVLQEAARRLALSIGHTPDVMYSGRDTGARTGKNTGPVRYPADTLRDKFSRNTSPRLGIPMRDAEAAAQAVREMYPTGPQIIVMDAVDKSPDDLLAKIYKAGAANDIEGAYHNGTIYMYPQHAASIERYVFVAAHHEIRHHGLRSMYKNQQTLDATLLAMRNRNPALKAAADAKRAEGFADSDSQATEEALADMPVEELAKLSGWDKVVTAVRQWLRNLAAKLRRTMPNLADAIDPMNWTDRDVAAMVRRAENISRGGGGGFRTSGTVFGRADEVTRSDTFRKWFGDSKVVDADGKPAVVYHGTGSSFDAFDPAKISGRGWYGAGFYFAVDPELAGGAGVYGFESSNRTFDDAVMSGRMGFNGYAWQAPKFALSRALTDKDLKVADRWFGQKYAQSSMREDFTVARDWGAAWRMARGGDVAGFQKWLATDGPLILRERLRAPNELTTAPNVMPVYLSIQNPAPSVEAFKADEQYDGVFVQERGGIWVTRRPEQIKSATGNSGAFDPDSADIRYSRAEQRRGTEDAARAAGFTLKAYRGISKASPFNDSGTTWLTTDRGVAEAYAEEVMGYNDPAVLEVMVKPDDLPRHDASRLTDEQREEMGADDFGNPQAVGIYDRSDDHPLGGSRRNVTVIHAPRDAVWEVSEAGAMFSRASTTPNQRFTTKAVRNTIADMLGDAGAKVSWWDKTLGTQYAKAQKFPAYKRVFDQVQQYLEDVSSLANDAADNAPGILPKLETWKDLKDFGMADADAKAIAGPIFAGTLNDEKVYSDAELKAKHKLNDKQIGLYREYMATVNTSLDQVVAADVVRLLGDKNPALQELAITDRAALREGVDSFLTDQIEKAEDDPENQQALTELRESIREKYIKVDDLKAKGYAPLMRFGRYAVNVENPATGESMFFGLYESKSAANSMARELAGDPEFRGMPISQGVLSSEQYKLFQAVPMESLEMFANAIGAERSAVFQEYLKLAKNNRSALKRLIKRKGTAGFSEDIPRVLASFTTSNARMASGAMNWTKAKEAIQDIRDGDIKDEAINLVEEVQNPGERAGMFRGLMFANFIGGSLASAVVNLTQPLMMTLPYLSQWGGGVKAGARLMAAGKMAASGKIGDLALSVALKRAEQDGIVSPQEIHHLTNQAMGTWGTNPYLQKAAFIWAAPFSLAEQFNRRVTFIAAYQTAKQEGLDDPFSFAEKAVTETQGLYNRGNAPNWTRNALGASALTFKQYSIHYLEWMGRMWKSGPEGKRAVGIALALLILAAGTDGLPGADDLDDLIDTLAQALGYDLNSKRARRNFVANTLGLGDQAADVAARGLSAIMGVPMDVSLRMSMGNLFPATGILLRSNTDRSRDLMEIAGPAGGLAKQYLDAGQAALRGDVGEAITAALPVALQNVLKGAGMWVNGEARDTKGAKIMETDGLDSVMKGIGFNPATIARESQKMGMIRRSEQLAKNVEGEIAADWARAIVDKDDDGKAAARQRMLDWNDDNPDARIKITMQQLVQRAKKLRESRASRFITSTSPERRARVTEEIQ